MKKCLLLLVESKSVYVDLDETLAKRQGKGTGDVNLNGKNGNWRQTDFAYRCCYSQGNPSLSFHSSLDTQYGTKRTYPLHIHNPQ